KLFHAGTTFRDRKLFTSGGRVMGVTAIAQDLPAAIERAYAAVSKVKFEGMHFRHDIGRKGLESRARGSGGGLAPLTSKEKRSQGSAKL
ncbi:MAG TPA: phosphoribosylglycinamide synthetase C domain-containing protein, partial [Terriglobia bacterium]|nr:phosphoribosylglycinamide synthetase C domain-containing protein [Terriglobia bacterium]